MSDTSSMPALYNLSPIQQGMLFHWLREPGAGTDIEQMVVELRESLDVEKLERAWQHALAVFDILRTEFRWEHLDSAKQLIAPNAVLDFGREDLRRLDPDDRLERWERFLRDDRLRGFDLATAPAMRVTLVRLGDDDYRMVWTFHHILIDGRNFNVILEEVFAHYAGAPSVVRPTRPYRDFIEWIDSLDQSDALAFWREELKGFSSPTALLSSSDAHRAEQFGQRRATLDAELTMRLRQLAERAEGSMNTLMLGAWAFLLARYSGESDVVLGATKTTRRGTIAGADEMLGVFLATIPFRVTVDDTTTVSRWLRGVRQRWVALRGREHLPLVEIKQCSEVPPTDQLFDSLVVFEGYAFGERLKEKGGSWARRDFQIREQTGLPLTLKVTDGETLRLTIEYDARQFGEGTAARILDHVVSVLSSWAEDDDAPLGETRLLTRAERDRVLEEFNDTAVASDAADVAALITQQAAVRPDAIAVVATDGSLSYKELNDSANQLARELRNHGVGPNAPVGIYLNRSSGLAISLLAVMKAGGAYVPLDPSFPADRIAYMLRDSGAHAVVTSGGLRAAIPDFDGEIIDVDADQWRQQSTDDLSVTAGGDDLAYILYTSGSTGQPKGVMISRASLQNFLHAMRTSLGVSARDRLLAITTISFDIAGLELWLPWIVGAQVILASRDQATDAAELIRLVDQHDITVMQATPVTWRMMVDAGWTGKSDLQVLCGGEAMPAALASELPRMVGALWNMYGPTETTIWSTSERVLPGQQHIAIGRPIANTRCYILDTRRQPVPIGVTAELYIAGAGVSKGYLNRRELTSSKFIPDPFAADRGLMYATGDLARYRHDGTIECLGRTDHQVKIRGYRIELGEIEACLELHPAVVQAVVDARGEGVTGKRLIAYVVPSAGPPSPGELREHLRQSLPEYFLPAAFVFLPEIPVTANGKVDRKALPDVTVETSAPKAGTSARTYVEKQLSEIWEEVFGLQRVSVEDDFFDLGGHSILAMSVMAKIERVFGVRLPLNTLFESPTISRLATHLERDQPTVGQHTLVSIQASGNRPPIFWIPGGAALGLFSLRHIVTRLGPDQPVYGLGSQYPACLEDVESVETRAGNYLTLVRQIQPHGPYCLSGYCAGGLVAFEMAQRLVAAGETVAFLGMINSRLPRFPRGRIRRLAVRLQRLRFELGAEHERGVSAWRYVREKMAARKAAQAERARLMQAKAVVAQDGFKERDTAQNEILLQATIDTFSAYEPRPYSGHLSLFVSDDEELRGVSRALDPRFAWRSTAKSHEILDFPGGHEAIGELPHAAHFAERLKEALDAALSRS